MLTRPFMTFGQYNDPLVTTIVILQQFLSVVVLSPINIINEATDHFKVARIVLLCRLLLFFLFSLPVGLASLLSAPPTKST